MIQAIGLTSTVRRKRPPQVDDLTFEARPGEVTVLLGPAGSGKSEALRLLLQLVPGRGVGLFRGRPVQRIPHPAREIGVLLGDVPAHPARTARGQLRMLTAVAGVPLDRADEVLDLVGLSGLADQRLGDFSLGMDRRLGMAAALLGDPHTLVLDEPTRGLSPREATWLTGLLRGYVRQGGLVLATSRDPRQTARTADRVVSLDRGRLVADQTAADFSRTRLRPRVAVRTPHAERFAAVLSQEARSGERAGAGRGAMEVVCEGGSRVSVYGSDCAAVGESAYRHGILVHLLAEEVGDVGDRSGPGPLHRADGRAAQPEAESAGAAATGAEKPADGADAETCRGDHGGRAESEEAAAHDEEEGAGSAGHASVPAPGSYKPGGPAVGRDGADAEGESPAGPRAGAGSGTQSAGRREAEAGEDAAEVGPAVPGRNAGERAPAAEDTAVQEGALVPAGHDDAEAVAGTAGERSRRVHRGSGPSRGGPAQSGTDQAPAPSPDSTSAPAPAPEERQVPAADESARTEPRAPAQGAEPAAPGERNPAAAVQDQGPRTAASLLSASDGADRGSGTAAGPKAGKTSATGAGLRSPGNGPSGPSGRSASAGSAHAAPAGGRVLPLSAVVRRPGPVAPLRYELMRLFGVRTPWVLILAALVSGLVISVVTAGTAGIPAVPATGTAPGLKLLTGWPPGSPFLVPPAAVVAGLLGALAFGQEFRYPALVPAHVPVPRRLGLLVAKLGVTAGTAVALCLATVLCNAVALSLLYGPDRLAAAFPAHAFDIADLAGLSVPGGSGVGEQAPSVGVQTLALLALCVGCAWAGLLAAGVFRSTVLGVAAVAAVPTLVAPLVWSAAAGPGGASFEGLSDRLRSTMLLPWPSAAEQSGAVAMGVVAQPVGRALALSVTVLFCLYALTSLRGRPRQR
ncbi:ATP-binding cassette domain-containing protein [Streptomyces qinglanensis]|uniref:ABC-type multidrug transport system, ATPase component n=1 Tax=Streptomyces qinglanensis TaxID=943816 RepID=A0A1H9WPF3_9ACTN|nr:ATP-binding cassette domain-containing protein [Streptomyces qinglanensis]SES35802.1 ABC-type multidrug transport system, ATPase component [Streptomyces qinglanensis]